MGCTASTQIDENDPDYLQRLQNKEVERMLLQHQQQGKNKIKVLLLGAGESGKSTVLKQMRLLHKGGFTDQERFQYKNTIWADAVACMQNLILQARRKKISLDCDNPENRVLFEHRHKLLHYNPIDNIDTNAAGGFTFLKEYATKYNESDETRRKIMNQGRGKYGNTPQAGWDDTDLSTGEANESNVLEDEAVRDLLQDSAKAGSSKKFTKLEIAEAIQDLWFNDKGIAAIYKKSNEFHLEVSAPYFFEHADSFAKDDYRCTDEDILRGRIKTVGITETNFNINNTKLTVLDAGGQRSERKKWIHCFEGITCVCFVVAVSEYDEYLLEDSRTNRMIEAMMLFESICNSKWFIDTPFMLFLNKTDILKEKIRRSPIRSTFELYDGKTNDVKDALSFFTSIFSGLNNNKKRPIYIHPTTATDTESMKFMVNALTDMAIQDGMREIGFM